MIEIVLNFSSQKLNQIDICWHFLTNKMCDNKIECTLPRIAGIRAQINTQSLPWGKQITIQEKRTEIFAIATVAPPQVSYGFYY
jgi:hypothetical protein